MSSGACDISLVVSSRNRAYGLDSCLEAIGRAAQAADPTTVELVFVDNGSTDDTSAVVAAWAKSAPLPVRLLHEARPGLAVPATQASRRRVAASSPSPTMTANRNQASSRPWRKPLPPTKGRSCGADGWSSATHGTFPSP